MNRKGNHLLKSARKRERASKRASDCSRVTYVRNFQQKLTGFTVGAMHRPSYLDLEIGTITRECARRKQKKKQRKAESGEREREREERGKTRMHFCLHLPVTSEGTSCLGLLSPGGHYYCFKLACSLLRLPFSLQAPLRALPFRVYPLHRRTCVYKSDFIRERKECRAGHCSRINYMLMRIPCRISFSNAR